MTLRFALLSVLLLPLEVVLAEVSADSDFFGKSIRPLMENYCMECHGADTQKGDVRFDTIDPNVVSGKDVGVWEDSLHRLGIREMPPEKKEQPSGAQREAVTKWITRELNKHLTVQVGVPGRVVVRRLNRGDFKRIPLANMYVSVANAMGVPTRAFAGITGPLTGLI